MIIAMLIGLSGISTPAFSQQLFFDDFEGGADPAWGNKSGSWSAHDGIYDAAYPDDNPATYTSLTSHAALTDIIIELDINNVDDGGVWLRSDYNGGGRSTASCWLRGASTAPTTDSTGTSSRMESLGRSWAKRQ